MQYFNENEIRNLINTIDTQDTWDTKEMQEFIEAAVKESDDTLNPADYDDPDRLYEACKAVFGIDSNKAGVITVEDFERCVKEFGFRSPVVTAVWNTMNNNPDNSKEFEIVYARWATGRYKEDRYDCKRNPESY